MIVRYFANHYANGGNWTHIVDLYYAIDDKLIRFELARATHIMKVVKPVLSKEQQERLKDAMKWRDDLFINEHGKNPYEAQ